MFKFNSSRSFLSRKFVSLIIITAIVSMMSVVYTSATSFALNGAGTNENPYLVTSCADFMTVGASDHASYLLTTSIDCASNGNNIMIAGQYVGFFGTFDGGGHTINVLINANQANVSLFRILQDATIKNVTVTGSITGTIGTAAIAGNSNGATFDNIQVEATIIGGTNSGAIAGAVDDCDLSNLTSSGNVTGANSGTGGIVGNMNNARLDSSFSSGEVLGAARVGGAVGTATNGSQITNTSTESDVVGTSIAVGGFIGDSARSTVTNSEASGNVTGQTAVGGFAGRALTSNLFQFDSAAGNVSASGSNAGGFVGYVPANGTEDPAANFAQSYSTGDVSGAANVGGFIGQGLHIEIYQAYSSGDVSGSGNEVGGFAGYIEGGSGGEDRETIIQESFSTGDVSTAGDDVGGFVGGMNSTNLRNNYARGNVTGHYNQAGFVGSLANSEIHQSFSTGSGSSEDDFGGFTYDTDGESPVQDSFWDTQTSGTESSADGNAKTTLQLKALSTYTELEDPYDFELVWSGPGTEEDNDGYACLRWSYVSCPSLAPDNDSVDDETENAAPNGGDGNNDGIVDSDEDNVVSFVSPITEKYVTLETDADCVIEDANVIDETANSVQDASYNYPTGVFDFTILCATTNVVTINMYYHDLTITNPIFRKYHTITDTYTTLDVDVVSETNEDDSDVVHVSYQIADNGSDDDDPADGVIADPVGFAVAAPNAVTPTTQIIAAPTQGSLPATGANSGSDLQFAMFLLICGLMAATGASRMKSRRKETLRV